MKNVKRLVLGMVGLIACAGSAGAGFEAGNLVVVRVGDGKPSGKGSAVAVFLDEINPATGIVVRSIPLPTESRSSQRRLTLSMSATSEGQLALSSDGRYLTLAGYDAPLQMAKVPGSPSDAVPRVIARVDASGRVDTSTDISDGYSKNNVRGAVTVDGRTFYLAGAGTGGGSRSVDFAAEGDSKLLANAPNNTRGVAIFEGRLYASAATGEVKGIVIVGEGLPTEAGQTATLIAASPSVEEPKPGSPTAPAATDPAAATDPDASQPGPVAFMDPKPTGFIFLGGKLYVADLAAGLLIYEPDGMPERGLTRYKLSAIKEILNLTCLAGRLVDGKPIVFGTDGERLLRFTFDGPEISMNEVAKAGPYRAFRGVAFVPTVFGPPPIPLPAAVGIGIVGLACPSVVLFSIRRKLRRRVRYVGTDILMQGGPA